MGGGPPMEVRAMTHVLDIVAAIRETRGKLTYRELHKRTLAKLVKGDFDQVPQLEGRKTRFDAPFLSPEA